MNGLIKHLSSDKTVWWSVIFSLAILVLTLFFVLLFYRALPPVIPIFNQLPWGTERLSTKLALLLPPGVAFVILIINVFMTNLISEKLPVVARMLTITTLLIALLTIVFVFRIIQLIM